MSAVAALRERVTAWLGRGEGASPMRLPRSLGGPDRLLCGAVLALTAFGVVMVFSASFGFAAKKYGDWIYFLKRDALYAAAGVGAFAFGLRTDYVHYRRWSYLLLFLAIAMLGGVLLFGTRVGGAVRWFRLGPLSFQPSEVAKFALALYLAVLLARKAENVKTFSMGFLPPLVMTGLVVALLLKQPDLGNGVILGVMALGMLFVAGTRTSYILLAVLLAAPVGWKVFITGTPWRMRRMLAFLDPWQYCQTAGYQLCESLISVGSGGLTGQGLGGSRQKLFFLPEAHTDFILAIIAEELGLFGLLGVLGAFSTIIWRGYLASTRARDLFGSYLAFGLTSLFGLQALVNMSVVMGLLPTKGLPLPFISYGGTSLVVSLFMAGVLGNISARNPEPRPAPLFGALRRRIRMAPGKNKRADRGATVIVELPKRRKRAARVAAPTPEPPDVETIDFEASDVEASLVEAVDEASILEESAVAAPEGALAEGPTDRDHAG